MNYINYCHINGNVTKAIKSENGAPSNIDLVIIQNNYDHWNLDYCIQVDNVVYKLNQKLEHTN